MKCRKVCLICLVCLLTACNAVPEASVSTEQIPSETEETSLIVLHPEMSIKMYETMDQCVADADYILTYTVAEIGETYIYGNKELPENATPEEVNNYIRSICTPVTLSVHDVYYANQEIGDTMEIVLREGIYNGYKLEKDFPQYEEGHTYLLFLRTAPDGITNMVMHQGSAEIMVSDTALYDAQSTAYACVPLYNERIYQELHTVNDIAQSVQEAD